MNNKLIIEELEQAIDSARLYNDGRTYCDKCVVNFVPIISALKRADELAKGLEDIEFDCYHIGGHDDDCGLSGTEVKALLAKYNKE